MPKKGKKGKGGKGKKGKKSSKKGGKKNDDIKSMAEANSKMWEARLDVVEQSRLEYRENARKLVLENDTLQQHMEQTEKDTMDVVTFLKKQDQQKEVEIERLHQQIKDVKKENRKEKEQIIDDFQQQLAEVEQKLRERTQEVEVMQSELKLVKEFRRKRGQMQKELDEIKETMLDANREHKETLTRLEQKFFEEKMRLQQESNQKIAELAERAHTEAIVNLDETTRSVYKENIRSSEALSYHMAEEDRLKKLQEQLEEENQALVGEKELNGMVIKEKIQQVKHQKQHIKQLQEKVETLEQALSHMVKEFDTERTRLIETAKIENESAKTELSKLQRMVDLKTKEMTKVKKLARNILDQRTEMERFFLESLEQVKLEIAANQAQYRRDAHLAYQQKMLAAHVGKGDFPKIRTFNKSERSTNSVFHDLEAAERMLELSGKVDISELTWEQREKVLRYLFAKMNGARDSHRSKSASEVALTSHSVPAISNTAAFTSTEKPEGDYADATFLTQGAHIQVDDQSSVERLPSLAIVSAPLHTTAATS